MYNILRTLSKQKRKYNTKNFTLLFAIRVSEGQEEVRMTKEDVENASGEGEQECQIREKDAMN